MSDTQLPPNANDGTIEGAVAALSDTAVGDLISFDDAANRDAGLPPPDDMAKLADKREAEKLQPRTPDGKWTKPETAPQAEANQPAEPAAETSEAAEEFFEFTPDGSDKPERVPAKEVFDGWQEAKALRTELEQARRVQPPPVGPLLA